MRVLDHADVDQLRSLHGGDEPLWLDLRSPANDELDAVGEILGLHPLAIEDSREFGQRPKLDRYDERFLLVFFGVWLDDEQNPQQVEVHIHVAAGAVLTVSRVPPAELDRVRDRLKDTPDCSRGQLVYRILDAVTDSVSDGLDTIAGRIDGVARTILTRPRVNDRDRMSLLSRSLSPLQRTLSIQRPVFDHATDQIVGIAAPDEDLHPYLADVADHLSQALDDVAAAHDALRAMIDAYSNAVQERLTIVATIFLPLSVVTGFFGMNFNWLVDRLGGTWTFWGLGVGGLLLSSLLIVAWLRQTGMLDHKQQPETRHAGTAGASADDVPDATP